MNANVEQCARILHQCQPPSRRSGRRGAQCMKSDDRTNTRAAASVARTYCRQEEKHYASTLP
eukprot:3952225-Pleurochrysis_carterae.AAC.2